MEDLKYIYIEEMNECNICWNIFNECFKCKRCIFLCCPKCFNHYYFLDDETNCPMCRF